MKSRDHFFDICGRIGILAFLALWMLLAKGIGGLPAFALILLSLCGNVMYVNHQRALRAAGLAHPEGKDLILACLLSMVAMFGTSVLMLSYFSVLFTPLR